MEACISRERLGRRKCRPFCGVKDAPPCDCRLCSYPASSFSLLQVHQEYLKRRYVAPWCSGACVLNFFIVTAACILPLYIGWASHCEERGARSQTGKEAGAPLSRFHTSMPFCHSHLLPCSFLDSRSLQMGATDSHLQEHSHSGAARHQGHVSCEHGWHWAGG